LPEAAPQTTDLHRIAGEASKHILLYFESYRIASMAPIVAHIELELKAERERCARRVERFFAPCYGHLERHYGANLAAHIREGT